MADPRTCDTCGLTVPGDTEVCPRDGTVLLGLSPPFSGRAENNGRAPMSPRNTVNPTQPALSVMIDEALEQDPLIGLKIGEYELRQRIGVGGMGLVYDGIQPLIGKRVAVKVLRPELAAASEQVARLLAEARAVNAIRHRGIIDIFGFGQVPDGRQYIVMEYLEGQALDAYLVDKGKLSIAETLDILDEVLSALGAAHGAGVVHRDLKPSNIFLVRQPDGSRYVKLLDFGLAKQGQGPTGRTAQTRTDMVVGTPEYMAPEQARGQPVGPMTDIYALGVVAFEMVTGRLPFTAGSPVDMLLKHVDAQPPRPSDFVPELPASLDAFILQMLTKDPEVRPGSAEALRRQLLRLRESLLKPAAARVPEVEARPVAKPVAPLPPAALTPPPTPPPAQPLPPEPSTDVVRQAGMKPETRRLVYAGVGTVVLGLLLGLFLTLRQTPPPPAPVAEVKPAAPPAAVKPPPPTPPEPLTPPPGTATAEAPTGPTPVDAPPTPPAPSAEQGQTVPAVGQKAPTETKPVAQTTKRRTACTTQLLGRINFLQLALDKRAQSGTPTSPSASSTLKDLHADARRAKTQPQCDEVSAGLDTWQRMFLGIQ
jgi:serine/threonine-protein kinase